MRAPAQRSATRPALQPPTWRRATPAVTPRRPAALDRDAVQAPVEADVAAPSPPSVSPPTATPTPSLDVQASVEVDATTAPPPPSATPMRIRPRFTVAVSAREARAGLRVEEIWDGEAPAIVVTAVGGDGDLAAAGVAPGLRLLSLPHPTRRGERWELIPGNAPVSRVRDLLRVYRGVEMDIEFSVDGIPEEAIQAWIEEREQRAAGVEAAAAAAADATASSDGDESTSSQSAADADAERAARALARRLARRAERNAIEAQRDDTPLLVWSAVAFLGPAAIILAIAAGTGYLDKLRLTLL